MVKKGGPFQGLFLVFFSLVLLCFIFNLSYFAGEFNASEIFTFSVAQSTLTGLNYESIEYEFSTGYIIYSLVINQASGVLFLSFLLWIYWKLFSNKDEPYSLKKAIWLTVKISAISELLLFIFFTYAIPLELTKSGISDKILAAFLLSINSFNNAGIGFVHQVLIPSAVQKSFIIQIGIIAGNTIGGLGIFVIDELFSPKNLRQRLKHPEIDWSAITKLSVFGAAFVLILFPLIFYFNEKNQLLANYNLVESIIASVYEVSSGRGFGHSLFNIQNHDLILVSSLFSAGVFSSGGGFTMLVFLKALSPFIARNRLPGSSQKLFSLAKNHMLTMAIALGIVLVMLLIIRNVSDGDLSALSLWNVFSTIQCSFDPNQNWYSDIFLGFVTIVGRLSFIASCFLTLEKNRSI